MVIHEEKNKNMTNKSFKMTTAKPFSWNLDPLGFFSRNMVSRCKV